MRYEYTDLDADRLKIEAPGWPGDTASVSINGIAVFVPAAEAPKAAQAILDAAGVQGVVIVGSNINVTLGDKAESDWEERHQAEVKAAEEAAVKKAHDDLRTSPIALKALALYNRECIGYGPYASWADVNCGAGAQDHVVRKFIEYAEAAESKEKEAAEKLAARRLDIYKELGGVFFSNFEPQSPIGYAIDRIIALEDKAA